VLGEIPSVGEVWIFSGTKHCSVVFIYSVLSVYTWQTSQANILYRVDISRLVQVDIVYSANIVYYSDSYTIYVLITHVVLI